MESFNFDIPKYPYWAEAEPLLKKIFCPWLLSLRTASRNDSPHLEAALKRHGRAVRLQRRRPAKRGSGLWRMHSVDRRSLAWKVEWQLNIDIQTALKQHNVAEALKYLRRYVALPFESTKNQLWRKAFIQEYDGDIDGAVKTYQTLAKIITAEKQGGGLFLLTYKLVSLAPEVVEHRQLRAKHFIQNGSLRCAVNELQVLKRLQRNNGDNRCAEKTLKAIRALVDELKRKRRLERRGPPEGEFSFEFDEDDQVELNLEEVEI